MKIPLIANNIIKKELTLINILKGKKRDEVNVISLLLCELYFTSNHKRLFEYIVWYFLSLVKSNKRNFISVGVSQVQIRHWLSHNSINSNDIFKSFLQFQNVSANYDLIEKIFCKYNLGSLDDSKIVAIYRGEARAYHLNLFVALKKQLTAPNMGLPMPRCP